jgi:hypothetical protein
MLKKAFRKSKEMRKFQHRRTISNQSIKSASYKQCSEDFRTLHDKSKKKN